ncbi:serine/threonine protein kinase [Aspergillus saccharolyticus JOP 1030-1]|uniref:Serine/threonine protein kinase n=1 Tax=Aspergillus saccharolyticus JOP 1030-1 TaxID=1450539 RepID=A0A319AM39_9EURO|nr:serine/threonine protein kinase [Aspergillus saccharolyticus JOP 1030-1]PYH47642.1 serine/threonine protein kinase [Aspergillus saccharolyticus JOP 1030-1]
MSGRPGITEKRLSAKRFHQLRDMAPDNMLNPNDVTIDIPLNTVPSRGQTGARKSSVNGPDSPDPYQPPVDSSEEKQGLVAPNPGLRRRIDESSGRSIDEPEDGTITRVGRFYQAVLNYSIATRYLIYVTPLALLLAIPIIVGATAAQDATIGGVTLPWFFFWFEIVWISLWACKLAARIIPYVFQTLCGFVSSGTRKYALILRKLEFPIATVLWCVVCLVTFLPVMTQNPHQKKVGDTSTKSWEKSIKNILFALFVCSLIFLGEKTVVHLISISYHRKQFDARIKEGKRNVHLISLLYDASRQMFPLHCKEFREEDAAIADFLLRDTSSGKTRLPTSGSAPLRMIRGVGQNVQKIGQNVQRIGGKVTAAFGDVAHELTGKQVFNPTSTRSIVAGALEHRRTSEALARRIWMSFVVEGRDALYFDDLCEVLGTGLEGEADECMKMLDRDGNGDISLDEMILAIGEVQRNKKALNNSLHDIDQATRVLDNLLMTVAFIVGLLVFVSFVTSGFGTVIAAGASALLSLSFVFSTTAQEVLGSCIFLFVKHPFDVGDRVEISDKPFFVERISLLFTVFRNVNDHRITQIPNSVLNSLWVDNFTRANAMHEVLKVPIDFDTTFQNIQRLRDELEEFVRDKDNCRDFQPDITIDVSGVGDMDKMELSVYIRHKSNWSNEAVRATRRSKFMCALIAAVRRVPIRKPGSGGGDDEKKPEDKLEDTPEIIVEDVVKRARRDSASNEPVVRRIPPTESSFATTESRSTGFDMGQSPNSIQRRGVGASVSSYSEGLSAEHAYPTSRDGQEADQYQTPAESPGPERTRSVNYGSVTREHSTGRRKEGTANIISTATGGVPVLSEPVPPRRQQGQQEQPPVRLVPEHQQAAAQTQQAGAAAAAANGASVARQQPEYYSYQGQYYHPVEEAYDPNQPFELPSMEEPSAEAEREYSSHTLASSRTAYSGESSEEQHQPRSYPARRNPYEGQ